LFCSGLQTRSFLDLSDVQEVLCSGHRLPAGFSLYAMVLFERHGDSILSSVDIQSRQCQTSHLFNLCHIDDRDSRMTTLRTLINDLKEGESKVLGCNASMKTSEGRFKVETWFVNVYRACEYYILNGDKMVYERVRGGWGEDRRERDSDSDSDSNIYYIRIKILGMPNLTICP
jgi:hypothetical protein